MEEIEKEVKKQLKKNLKGVTGSTLESIVKKLRTMPRDRVSVAMDLAISLAGVNLKSSVEMLKEAPEVSNLIEPADMRIWGEIGRRLAATSADTATGFFQTSGATLESVAPESRSQVLKLINKQAALSANTAIESFHASPGILLAMGEGENAERVLNICLELARHSVKHSSDLFSAAPRVLAQLDRAGSQDFPELTTTALELTSAFAFRSGGTAAEFFTELPEIVLGGDLASLRKLFETTEAYLDRSGGVALQYFKAAGRVLAAAGRDSFERWTALAKRVALQGNAASYHFMKQSPEIISELAGKVPAAKRSRVVEAVLELVEEIAEKNTAAAVECFKASPLALGAASLGQFRDWARRGLELSDNPRRVQAYYSLESKASQEALFQVEGGLTLDSVSHTLRLYVEALTGRSLHVASLGSIPDESKIGDGSTVYLPSVVAEFEDEAENFKLFKVLAAHGAGQIEFGTYLEDQPGTLAALAETRGAFAHRREKSQETTPPAKRRQHKNGQNIGFAKVLAEFPTYELALRLFTTVENGRIDHLLRRKYRGIRRDLDFVRMRLRERRPDIENVPPEMIPFELLFQIAICGSATEQARRAYPTLLGQLETILTNYVFRPDAEVSDSLIATRHIYDLFVEQPIHSDSENEESDQKTEGEDNQSAEPGAQQSGEQQEQQQQMEVRDDPFSLWSSDQRLDVTADEDLFSRLRGGETAEHDLEKGDVAFYYDEWDRELSDYRTRWCRVIERAGSRGSRGPAGARPACVLRVRSAT